MGRRLGALSGGRPKCLLSFAGETLIERLLGALAAAGVAEAVVVVGHRGDEVRAVAGRSRGALRVRCVENEGYRHGSVLSLWAAREDLGGEDVLVMDADVLGPAELVARLVRAPTANCFLLDSRVVPTGEEQMLCVRGERVWNIARGGLPGYELYGESVGFLKVSRADAGTLRAILERRVAAGEVDAEHEAIYPEFLAACATGYERVDDLPWIEVDFPEDVVRAEREIVPRLVGQAPRGGAPCSSDPRMRLKTVP